MALAEPNICLRAGGKLNAALEKKHCSFSYESYSVAHDVTYPSCKTPHIFHIASALCWTQSIHTRHFCRASRLTSGLSANLNWDKMIKSCSSFRRSKCYQAEPIKYWQWDVSSRIVRLRMRDSRFFHNVIPQEIVFFFLANVHRNWPPCQTDFQQALFSQICDMQAAANEASSWNLEQRRAVGYKGLSSLCLSNSTTPDLFWPKWHHLRATYQTLHRSLWRHKRLCASFLPICSSP